MPPRKSPSGNNSRLLAKSPTTCWEPWCATEVRIGVAPIMVAAVAAAATTTVVPRLPKNSHTCLMAWPSSRPIASTVKPNKCSFKTHSSSPNSTSNSERRAAYPRPLESAPVSGFEQLLPKAAAAATAAATTTMTNNNTNNPKPQSRASNLASDDCSEPWPICAFSTMLACPFGTLIHWARTTTKSNNNLPSALSPTRHRVPCCPYQP
mmetsp:Transcript_2464/g.6854  ORF Transcript_2464/g.6854 Transcript_2464/m.6854 type:complete len:208 (-) Transcript_2464:481-1104(-)